MLGIARLFFTMLRFVKTRFRYANVPREDFGLNDEEILLLDDSKLNQLVSLKNYRPYRDVENDEQIYHN